MAESRLARSCSESVVMGEEGDVLDRITRNASRNQDDVVDDMDGECGVRRCVLLDVSDTGVVSLLAAASL